MADGYYRKTSGLARSAGVFALTAIDWQFFIDGPVPADSKNKTPVARFQQVSGTE
jgi:hypothetical protein